MARDKFLQIRLTKGEQEVIRKAFNKEASTMAREYLIDKALETLTLEELEEIEEFENLKEHFTDVMLKGAKELGENELDVTEGVDWKMLYKVKMITDLYGRA